MEGIFKKISLSLARLVPIVRAEEEEELKDPQVVLREECQKEKCSQYFEKLETCNERVRSKKKTAESCEEEMIDFVNCLDHCVAKTLFSKLK